MMAEWKWQGPERLGIKIEKFTILYDDGDIFRYTTICIIWKRVLRTNEDDDKHS